MKRCLIIAGPNGAGKTTFAREFLPNEGNTPIYLNADLIASGIMPFAPDAVDGLAAKIFLTAVEESFSCQSDFAIESTLSGRTWLKRIRQWRESGYQFDMFYLRPPSVDVSIQRVRLRVSQGGHKVPEEVIRRRYERSLENLESYQKAVDNWVIWDTSAIRPRVIEYQWRSYQGRELDPFLRAAWKVCRRALRDNRPLPKWEDGQVLPTCPTEEIATLEQLMGPDNLTKARNTLHTSLH